MKLNGVNATVVGHVFDPQKPDSMPKFMRNKPIERQREWAERQTERYKVMKKCKTCGRPLIAEEVLAHETGHLPFQIRSQVRTLMALSPELRTRVLDAVKELQK